MKITLKHRDAAFAMTPLREANSLADLVLLKHLKDGLENYTASALVTVEIEKEKMFELYTRMSALREGHSARFSDSIMTSDGAYKSLIEQITEGAMAGNEDFIWLAQKVTEWRTNFEIMGQQDIDANLSFLQNLPI